MGLFGKTGTTLVVDVAAMLKIKGARGYIAPRQHLQTLRSLSRFVQREKINVTAVMTGQPLDKAPHNKVVEGVRVRYARSDDASGKELISALKQAGSSGVLVTEDAVLEKRVNRSGGKTLRVSTFRKMLDDGSEQAQGGGGSGGGDNSRQRNRRDRGPRPNRGGGQPQQQQQPAREPEEESGGSDISQMIDLVE
jgi:hypothetical protein